MTYLTHLECSLTGQTYDANQLIRLSDAGQPLLARYDLPKARTELDRDELMRRPAGMWRYHELLPVSDVADETHTVLNLLSAARLVTTDEATAEVTHEALIREWPTLRRWLDENRDNLRLHRHLTESAQEWQQLNRDSGELYRGARLEQAQEWANQHNDELNDLEREFLATSVTAEQRAIAEAQAQQQRELAQAQELATAQTQAASRARYFNIALFVILLLTIGTSAALVNAQRSRQERELLEAVTTVTVLEARETAVAADQLAIESTTDAFAAATINAQATSDIAANATRSAETAAEATAVFQNQDVDADGLTLTQELALETDPNEADSDSDGLLDGVEVALGTDPNNSDTDFDAIFDGEDNDPLRPYISALDLVTGNHDFGHTRSLRRAAGTPRYTTLPAQHRARWRNGATQPDFQC